MLTKHDLERSATAPAIPFIDPITVPESLRQTPHWVLWRWEQHGERWTKVPRRPVEVSHTAPAKSTDPATWGPFRDSHEAGGGVCGSYLFLDCFAEGRYGLGFVLSEEDPFCVIDLDDCRDRDTGGITPQAQAVIDRFATYTEVSPSGTGVKLFLLGKKPGERCRIKDHPGVEVYDRARFVAVTGKRLLSCPTEPQNRQMDLEVYYRELFPEQPQTPPPSAHYQPPLTLTIRDDEVIRRASAAANGSKFDRLWRGDCSDYKGDRSSADCALASILAFWVGPDAGRIESLMRQSGLRRAKWDRPDYLPRTIARAISGRSTFYGDQVLEGGCPYIPLIEDQENTGECTDTSDPLAGLPNPPPAYACKRGGASLLEHTEDTNRHRSCRHACDSWGCPVCRERNAHQWVTHLAECAQTAINEGCTLAVAEVTRDRFDRAFSRSIRRRHADWCALELVPGVLLVLIALPAGADAPAGSEPISFANACGKLVEWARGVRAGPEPFSRRNAKMRPVRTSKGWQLNRPEPSGQWKVVAPLDTQDPDDVLKIVRDEGGRVTCDTTDPGERGGTSLVWLTEWRADPVTAERITARLKCLDDLPVPPPPGRPPTDEELMACNPFTEGP